MNWKHGLMGVAVTSALMLGGASSWVYADDEEEGKTQLEKVRDLRTKIFDMFDEDDDGKLSDEEKLLFFAWLAKHFENAAEGDLDDLLWVINRHRVFVARWVEKKGLDPAVVRFFDDVKEGIEKVRDRHREAHDKAHDKREEARDKAGDKREEARDKAGDKREEARDRVRDRREEARDKAGDKREEAKDRAGDKREEARDKAGDKREEGRDKGRDKHKDWHKNMGDALDKDLKNKAPKKKPARKR